MKKKITLLWIIGSFFYSVSADQADASKWNVSSLLSDSNVSLLKGVIKEIYAPEELLQPLLVQRTTNLCKEEHRFLHNRMGFVQDALKQHFSIDHPLRIGFCCSGGGNRAMIGTLGLLTGAAKSHILDATLYLAGLSGSTWLLSEFCYLAATSYKKQSFEKVLADIKGCYCSMLSDYSMLHSYNIYAPPLISFESTDDVCLEIAKRWAYEQPMSLVNLFGSLVGDYALCLLGNDRLSEQWSTISIKVQKGAVPLPLCASIFEKSYINYGWFEMSPLQCGSAELGYIPVQYLGSKFSNGLLMTDGICPEYPISFYLGMYGSAFALTVQDIANIQKAQHKKITILKESNGENEYRTFLNNKVIQGIIQSTIKNIVTERNPLTYAQFPNFSQGLLSSALAHSETLGLFDAGIAFDLPLPLLLDRSERNLDVIFLYSSFPGQKKVLQDLVKYCYKEGKRFPDISMIEGEDLEHDDMTVINDPRLLFYDATLPTYIYFPTNHIDLYAPPYLTLNFRYTPLEIETLSTKIEQNFLSRIDEIKQILQLVAEQRYGKQ